MAEERLQKILARAGVASRRAAEQLILAGRVAVNGRVADQLGVKADPERDTVTVDGRPVRPAERPVYLMLNKPRGYVTTMKAQRLQRTVADLLGEHAAGLFPVGRLDRDTEGLLVLTNDGELALRMTHPRYGLEKEYHLEAAGTPDEAALRALRRGVVLDGRRTAPARVTVLRRTEQGNTWLRVVIREGRRRQVRRMLESVGHPVRRLIRVRVGPVKLGHLPSGAVRELRPGEVAALREAVAGAPDGGPRERRTRGRAGAGNGPPAAGRRRTRLA